MADSLAIRYAQALYSIALEENKSLEYQSALKTLNELFSEDEKILSFFSSEFISLEEKEAIVDKLSSPFELQNLSSFIKLLISHHRIRLFSKIQLEFNYLVNAANNVEEGIVYSTKMLEKAQIEKIEKAISENLGVKVELHNKVDESLIGGVKVVIKDRIYDGSIKNKLSLLKNELLGG